MTPQPLQAPETGDHSPGLLRTPPHNVEAERALLGAILLNNRAYDKVGSFLLAEHFTEAVNGRIYGAIGKLIEQGRQANPITLKTFLERDDMVIAAGGMKYIVALSSSMVTLVNSVEYGQMIYDLHLRRELICIGEDMVNGAYDAHIDDTALEQMEAAASRLDALTVNPGTGKHPTMAEAVAATVKEWEDADKDDGKGLSTGLNALDEAGGKLAGGDSIFIAGNTSMGKTALVTTVAKNAASAGKRVAFFTLEMNVKQLTGRLITAVTGIPGPRQRRRMLDQDQWGSVVDAAHDLAGLPLVVRYVPGLSLAGLRSMSRQIKRGGGLDLVIVDYLQIMTAPFDRYENRTQQIGRLTMGIKTLAGDLDVPIITLSQLSRDNWRRENPRPILPDLRDSGSIEQDADGVWFCFREEYFLERNKPDRKERETTEQYVERLTQWQNRLEASRGMAEVIVAKNRHGPPGTAHLAFDAKRAWFDDLPDRPVQEEMELR